MIRYLYKIDDKRVLSNSLAEDYDNGIIGSKLNENNVQQVSDLDYFDDFRNSLSTVSQSHVKREIRVIGLLQRE